jgi:hypothetical protein
MKLARKNAPACSQFRKGGITTPLTDTCALPTKLGFVSDACSSAPSAIATKARMPIQVHMIPLLLMFVGLLSSTN